MCTVTFIPAKEAFYITSNRDENINRGHTIEPKVQIENNIKLCYPKDEKSGGTWIGYNELNTVAVLLNGAFIKHNYKPPYKQSRGRIIPFILQQKNSYNALVDYSLEGIEPFTLILFFENELYEFRWDEIELHIKKLNNQNVYLWNSATLYSNEMEQNNFKDLTNFFSNNEMKDNEIVAFHQSKKYEHLLEKESIKNNIKTISTSQVKIEKSVCKIEYVSY